MSSNKENDPPYPAVEPTPVVEDRHACSQGDRQTFIRYEEEEEEEDDCPQDLPLPPLAVDFGPVAERVDKEHGPGTEERAQDLPLPPLPAVDALVEDRHACSQGDRQTFIRYEEEEEEEDDCPQDLPLPPLPAVESGPVAERVDKEHGPGTEERPQDLPLPPLPAVDFGPVAERVDREHGPGTEERPQDLPLPPLPADDSGPVAERVDKENGYPPCFSVKNGYRSLITCPELSTYGLAVSNTFNILICMSCKRAVPSKSSRLREHFNMKHHGSKFRHGAIQHILSSLDTLLEGEYTFPYDSTHTPDAFEEFEVQTGRFGCTHCLRTFVSKDAQSHHYSSYHKGMDKRDRVLLVDVSYQEMYTSIHHTPFRVNPKAPSDDNLLHALEGLGAQQITGVQNLLAEAKAYRVDMSLVGSRNARLINPLLTRTKWYELVDGKQVKHLKAQVDLGAHGTPLQRLQPFLKVFFDACVALIETSEVLVSQIINSSDPDKKYAVLFYYIHALTLCSISSGINNNPLDKHHQHDNGTLNSYILPVNHLLCALVFRPKKPLTMDSYHEFPTTPALQSRLAALLGFLKEEGGTQAQFDVIAHGIFLELWHRTWEVTKGNSFSDPTACFLALYCLQEDGAYKVPGSVSHILVRLLRAIRLVTLREIHRRHDLNAELDRCELAKELHCWVKGKANTTYSYLYSINQYAQALARSSQSLPRIWWSDHKGYTQMLYCGQPVSLDHLRGMIYHVQTRAAKLWSDVLYGLDIHITYPQLLSDNLTETAPKYSFLDDPRNTAFAEATPLLEKFMQNKEISKNFVLNDGSFNATGARQWLTCLAKLEALLITGIHMSSGGPARGTELTSMQMRNTSLRTRNTFALGPYLSIVRQYTKNSSMTSHDSLIPNAVDSFFADLLIQVHALARPLASFLAPKAVKELPESPQQYNDTLFMGFGKPFESRDLTAELLKLSESFLDWEMGIAAYRHIYIAFHRRHHPRITQQIEMSDDDTISALQSGHSLATENRIYGLSTSAMSSADEDTLQLFLETSTAWQRTLKVVPGGLGLTYKTSGYLDYEKLATQGTIPPLHPTAATPSSASLGAQALLAEFNRHNQSAHKTTHIKLDLMFDRLQAQAEQIQLLTTVVEKLSKAV